MEDRTTLKVPVSAAWLGGLGAVPFAALALAFALLDGWPRTSISHALVAYGATILSFLGGVHWGLAIAPSGASDQGNLRTRLMVSVVPSLVGWSALLVDTRPGLFILAAAIALMLWVDLRATRSRLAPAWYPKLRIPLSCAVVATLLIGALG